MALWWGQWLHGGANGDLFQEDLYYMACLPSLLQPEPLSPQQATADPCLCRRHSNTQRHVWLNICGVPGSWCTQSFVWALWPSLWWVWGLILNIISPLLPFYWGFSFALRHGISFFGWDPTFPCWWLFSSELRFLSGEDERMSFYSTRVMLLKYNCRKHLLGLIWVVNINTNH